MRKIKKVWLIILLLLCFPCIAFAQQSINQIKEKVYTYLSEEKYEQALEIINAGLESFPDDEDLLVLREKTEKLIRLETLSKSDEQEEEIPTFNEVNESDIEVEYRPPDSDPQRIKWRNTARMVLEGSYILGNGEIEQGPGIFLEKNNTYLGSNVRAEYYIPQFKKLIGFAMDYQGVYMNLTEYRFSGTYSNQIMTQLLLRSMMKEEEDARNTLILSLGGGIAVSHTSGNDGLFYYPLLQLGIYYESPFLYSLFSAEGAKNLILEINFNFLYVLRENMNTFQMDFAFGYNIGNFRFGPFIRSDNTDLTKWQTQIWTLGLRMGINL